LAGLGKFVSPLKDITETLSNASRSSIKSAFIEDLRDVQLTLRDIESALAPFGGGGGSIGTIDLSE
jgi:hypothetical protein